MGEAVRRPLGRGGEWGLAAASQVAEERPPQWPWERKVNQRWEEEESFARVSASSVGGCLFPTFCMGFICTLYGHSLS